MTTLVPIERVRQIRWLGLKHIEPCPADLVVLQCLPECGMIDQRTRARC